MFQDITCTFCGLSTNTGVTTALDILAVSVTFCCRIQMCGGINVSEQYPDDDILFTDTPKRFINNNE